MTRKNKDQGQLKMKFNKVYDLTPQEENEFYLHPSIRCVFRERRPSDDTLSQKQKLGFGLKAPFKVPMRPSAAEDALPVGESKKKVFRSKNGGADSKSKKASVTVPEPKAPEPKAPRAEQHEFEEDIDSFSFDKQQHDAFVARQRAARLHMQEESFEAESLAKSPASKKFESLTVT